MTLTLSLTLRLCWYRRAFASSFRIYVATGRHVFFQTTRSEMANPRQCRCHARPCALALAAGQLLRRQLQHGLHRTATHYVDHFIDRRTRLFDQIDHWQQKLSVLDKELYHSPVLCPFYSGLLSVSFLHGGSPLLIEVSNPILSESGR